MNSENRTRRMTEKRGLPFCLPLFALCLLLSLIALAGPRAVPGGVPPLPSAFSLLPSGFSGQTPIITTRPTSTYRVSFSVACGGSGDCVTLFASASSLVRVREVWISKPSGAITVAIIKRSAADTGGTSSALTAVKFRSDAGAATATTLAYTVAPTAGTSAGTLISQSMATTDTLVQDFGTLNDQALTLESATEGLAINVSGAVTLTGYMEWTEP